MYNMGMCVDKPFLLFRFPDNHETKVPSESAANIYAFFPKNVTQKYVIVVYGMVFHC